MAYIRVLQMRAIRLQDKMFQVKAPDQILIHVTGNQPEFDSREVVQKAAKNVAS